MKKILITQRIIESKNYLRDAIDHDLVKFVIMIGFCPILVPNVLVASEKQLNNWMKIINPCGLVLSGGNDLKEFKSRDMLEQKLIKLFIKKNKPILGICRGAQIIARFFNNDVVKIKDHVSKCHFLLTKKNFFSNNYVNSYHNFGIKKLNNKFEILAKCKKDNTIEAFRHTSYKILGIMWHPERFKKKRNDQRAFIRNFLNNDA